MPNTFQMHQPVGALLLRPASAPWWIAAALAALMLWGFVQLLNESVQRGEALRQSQRQESADQLARWRDAPRAAEVVPVVLPALTRARLPQRTAPREAPRVTQTLPVDSLSSDRSVLAVGEGEPLPAFRHHDDQASDLPMSGQRVAWGR